MCALMRMVIFSTVKYIFYLCLRFDSVFYISHRKRVSRGDTRPHFWFTAGFQILYVNYSTCIGYRGFTRKHCSVCVSLRNPTDEVLSIDSSQAFPFQSYFLYHSLRKRVSRGVMRPHFLFAAGFQILFVNQYMFRIHGFHKISLFGLRILEKPYRPLLVSE